MTDQIQKLAEQQRAYWNSPESEKWINNQPRLDRMFVPMTGILFDYAQIKAGEKILDVGCGAGTTTRHLAKQTGESGQVLGIDISAPLLAAARAQSTHDHVQFFEGDAGSAEVPIEDVDLIISRFGVMFFADPARAFTHMRTSLKPEGRLCFVCWGSREDNPWFRMPYDVIAARLGPLEPAAPRAPGPMAYAQVEHIEEFLDQAGFDNIIVETRTVPLISNKGAAKTAEFLISFGPGARILANFDIDETTRQQLINDLAGMIKTFEQAEGTHVPAKLHFVRAANSR